MTGAPILPSHLPTRARFVSIPERGEALLEADDELQVWQRRPRRRPALEATDMQEGVLMMFGAGLGGGLLTIVVLLIGWRVRAQYLGLSEFLMLLSIAIPVSMASALIFKMAAEV